MATIACAVHAEMPGDSPFVSPNTHSANPKIYGKTYGEWAGEWWKWAVSFPEGADTNPVQDETGDLCHLGQSGPVWFLAGTFGVTGVERDCTIPAGTAIFYPLANVAWVDFPGDEIVSDEEVSWIVADYMDTFCEARSTLDTFDMPIFGEQAAPITARKQPVVRAQSPKVRADLPDGNIYGLPPGTNERVIGEGYWVMLPPLTRGEHLLTLYGARCDPLVDEATEEEIGLEKVFETEVTYHLTVVPGKGK
jgi:hypothetical protein